MYCNKIIHNHMPFFISKYRYNLLKTECCDEQCLGNRDHEIVCINCEQIDGYDPIQEFCSFHDDKHKIIKN